jgi:hypothetical protein
MGNQGGKEVREKKKKKKKSCKKNRTCERVEVGFDLKNENKTKQKLSRELRIKKSHDWNDEYK